MRRFVILVIAFFTLSSADIVEYPVLQTPFDSQAKTKAIYIYSLSKNFEWTTNNDGNFTINVLGTNTGLVNELSNMAKTKTMGNQKMEVKSSSATNEVDKCNILYITSDKSSFLAEAVSKFKGKGVLIITEKTGLAKVGSVLNFIVKDNKLAYELNKTAAKHAGLNVGASVEKQADSVY